MGYFAYGVLGVLAVDVFGLGKKGDKGEGMHEVALMQETLAIALARATEERAQRIHRITMRVGPLSGAVPEALEFAFDVVAHGTIAEGAQFEIEPTPIICYCSACALEFTPADFFCVCPRCEQPSAEVRRGRELELVSLEVS